MSDSVTHVQHVPKCKPNEHPIGQHVLHECYVAMHYQRCDALQNLLDTAARLWNLSKLTPSIVWNLPEMSGALRNLNRNPPHLNFNSTFQIRLSNTSGTLHNPARVDVSDCHSRTFVATPKLLGQKRLLDCLCVRDSFPAIGTVNSHIAHDYSLHEI